MSAVDRLCDLVRHWTEHEDVPPSQQQKARAIGEDLNKAGGMGAMTEAYYAAKAENRAAAVLQYYWDGIGEWRC